MRKIEILDNGQVEVPAEIMMMDFEIAQLFRVTISMVRAKIKATMKSKVVSYGANFDVGFNLEMIISVAFQVDSYEADIFRKWVIRTIAQNNVQPIFVTLPNDKYSC